MKTENTDLMRMAREALTGKWGLAVGTFVVYILCLQALVIPFSLTGLRVVGQLIIILLAGPFQFGLCTFSLSIGRGQDASLAQLFRGFDFFGKALATYLLMGIYIILWTLLLIVPGIIAALSYSMTFFILADDPSLAPGEAIDRSKQLMDGYKGKLFVLGLWFFLLGLACILTLGIGFLWLIPYCKVTMAKFYDDLKTEPKYFSFDV